MINPENSKLAIEFADLQELQRISSSLIEEDDIEALYQKILGTACIIMRSEIATIQKLIPEQNELFLLAHKGLDQESANNWKWVRLNDGSSCSMAMSSCERIIIPDHEASNFPPKDLAPFRKAGIRASQSTQLVTRTGRLVGMISTHWSKVHAPSNHELQLLDMLARQTADLLERLTTEEALRQSDARFRALVLANSSMLYEMNGDWSEMISFQGKNFTIDTHKPLKDWLDLYIPLDEQARVVEAIQDAIRTKSVFELEHRIIQANGREGWIVSCAVPLLNGEGQIVEWFGAATDITERKNIEQTLKDTHRRKDEFLAMLSHELRNPLAAISNSVYVLSHSSPESDAARNAQAIITRQIAQMTHLVDDLLDITRITQNKIQLKLQQVDINEIIRQTSEDHDVIFQNLGISLRTQLASTPILVMADPVRISQIVSNLLQNAAKFSSRGEVTKLSVECANSEVIISVKDNGVGIEPALIQNLFKPFTQADRTLDRSQGGLGLGLSLVKGLVELHGGNINVISAGKDQGSEFILKLPLAANIENEKKENKFQAVKQQNSQIVLIIEDSISVAESLSEVIKIFGHSVYLSHQGYDGIEKAREIMPDFVLCDIGLPGIDGYEVAKIFKADEKLRSICLIALTGYASAEDISKAHVAGFDYHMAKPPNFETLRELLAKN